SPWSRLRAWWSRNWTPVLVSAAAAAAVAFWISRGAGPGAADAPDNAGPIAIDSVSNEGNKTVLISMPAEDGGATVIWLLDEESDDGQPVDGEDPI
ncbi:MAG: hypothetical protein KC620_00435, partial [Myxococcales bacterium]|nr:hypothetical protein [Myxococcales bacterium]